MPCDPNTLIAEARCLEACIPPQMLQAVQVSLLCQIAEAGGGGGGVESFNARTGAVTLELGDVSAVADATYVNVTGDTMTGELLINRGTQSVGLGEALELRAVFDDGGASDQFFRLLRLMADGSSGNWVDAPLALAVENPVGGVLASIDYLGNASLQALGVTNLTIGGSLAHLGSTVGFFSTAPIVKQASGANLTNNVTAGGTDDTIANFTSLTVYATDAAAIRNDIYQLARKVKQINDGLRSYGLFT